MKERRVRAITGSTKWSLKGQAPFISGTFSNRVRQRDYEAYYSCANVLTIIEDNKTHPHTFKCLANEREGVCKGEGGREEAVRRERAGEGRGVI